MSGRYCQDCQEWCDSDEFSMNQWRKGNGTSRCYSCVNATQQTVYCSHGCGAFSSDNALAMHMRSHRDARCSECDRNFGNGPGASNQLQMHLQTHVARQVPCPVCGDRYFRTSANAVSHVESGSCSGCRGVENASQQIYRFTQMSAPHLIGGQRMLEYGGGSMPPNPYQCQYCDRSFKQLSAMMQHSQMKHSSGLAIAW